LPEADDPVFLELNDTYALNEANNAKRDRFFYKDVETPADQLMLQAASLTRTRLSKRLSISGLADTRPRQAAHYDRCPKPYGEAKILLGRSATALRPGTPTITIRFKNSNEAPRVVTIP
jgi:hypothetical protein